MCCKPPEKISISIPPTILAGTTADRTDQAVQRDQRVGLGVQRFVEAGEVEEAGLAHGESIGAGWLVAL
jgi:hypothetical protein